MEPIVIMEFSEDQLAEIGRNAKEKEWWKAGKTG